MKAVCCYTTRRSSHDLQVHWLRVILDEGHMLGTSLNLTNKLSMAKHLKTERRWIMTGARLPWSLPFAHPSRHAM